ncbi:MAG: phosphoglycerate dehydrogenase [Coriobacteriia bacterium]
MKKKVLVAEKIAESGIEALKQHFDVDVKIGMSPEELIETIPPYHGLIVRSATKVTREVIEAAENLEIVGRAGVGVDNVDQEAATEKGVIVANAPTSNIVSAAEHTIALMLAQARNIPQANASMKQCKWERSKFVGTEVDGKTLGIVGLGRIGTLVAERAKGLGMRILAYDPYLSDDRAARLGVEVASDLDDLLAQADFITVHLPKTKETIGMFGPEEFAKMKDGVRLINTARGGIYQEEALVEALKSGKVASAGIDVYEVEPCTESPLFEFDQVIVTPHLGASTEEAQDRAGEQIAEQVIAGLTGQPVTNAVNIAPVAPEVLEAIQPFMGLADDLGKMLAQTLRGKVTALEVVFIGGLADVDTRMLKTAVLKGFLSQITPEGINFVNAEYHAEQRGIQVTERKTAESHAYVNAIKVVGTTEGGEPVSIGGALVGKKNQPRLTSLYGFDLDMIPTAHMSFFRYTDVPGMIGKIGTILGEHDINIASMQVGREKIGGDALMGLNVDTPVGPDLLELIVSQVGVEDAWSVEL